MERAGDGIEFFRHDNLADKSLLELSQLLLHDHEKLVVPDNLLSQHSVHGLVVHDWMLLLGLLEVKSLWKLLN